MEWIKTTLLEKYQNASPKDIDLFSIVDTEDEVVEIINNFYKKHHLSPNF